MSLIIVDTGCANLASVGFAFERLGAAFKITDDADEIYGADRVVLPGVGAAAHAMNNLREKSLIPVLQNLTQPVLGICLGMQLLFDGSEEGAAPGLGLIPGQVCDMDTGDLPSPHMGWNQLSNIQDDPLMDDVQSGSHVYFVHSYAVPVGEYTLASANYQQEFSAIVRSQNIWGCQFHPERSGSVGAKILENFLKVSR